MQLKVTICQLHDDPAGLESDWVELVAHVRAEESNLVLLPEMPFSPFPVTHVQPRGLGGRGCRAYGLGIQAQGPCARGRHRFAPDRLRQRALNEGFVWDAEKGIRGVHAKTFLPDEEGVWEASWYQRATPEFTPVPVFDAQVGFLICTELWCFEQARLYGMEGVHLLVTPRLTGGSTLDKWLVGGRAAAIAAGAFGLSSNRFDKSGAYGGQGWVVGPDGELLGLTSASEPFVSVPLDLEAAKKAKSTYPRYAISGSFPVAPH